MVLDKPSPHLYKIKLHPDVIHIDGKRFDSVTKEKIKKKCKELLSTHPEEAGEPLQGPLKHYRKLKVFNDYRVVYQVEKEEVIVFILAVGIRRDLEVYETALKRLSKH